MQISADPFESQPIKAHHARAWVAKPTGVGSLVFDSAGLPKCGGQSCKRPNGFTLVLPAFPKVLTSMAFAILRFHREAQLPLKNFAAPFSSTHSFMSTHYIPTTMKPAIHLQQPKSMPTKLSRARKARLRLRQLHRRRVQVHRVERN